MKKKLVENTPPIKTEENGWWATVQQAGNILILDICLNGHLCKRHCINVDTYEYATLLCNSGEWTAYNLSTALSLEQYWYYGYTWKEKLKEKIRMAADDEELVKKAMKTEEWVHAKYTAAEAVARREREYGAEKRERQEQNRIDRVNKTMGKVPPLPEGIKEWIDQREINGLDYMLKNKETGMYGCSGCGGQAGEKLLKRVDGGKKVRSGDMVICPACKKQVKVVKRKKAVDILTRFAIVQPIDNEVSVMRHFDAVIYCDGGRKGIGIDEAVRLVLFKNGKGCDIYYNQYGRSRGWITKTGCAQVFDNKSNPANRRICAGFLYDGGIEEEFKGTRYQRWGRLFAQMAAAGIKLNYNLLMCSKDGGNMVRLAEMLFKGRFYRLLAETAERISVWNGAYCGNMRLTGSSMEDAFGIGDRQKINRIRDRNGGQQMVEWMRWSERRRQKISEKAMGWLMENKLSCTEMQWMGVRFSLEQAVNYIERQKKETYQGKTAKQVIAQYEDYMDMCEKLHKNTSDEMVYRPRELKRRHDEAVKEIELRQAELDAEKYSRKFKDAEDVLREVKEKFEYASGKYVVTVPQRIVDIVLEGRALHHCAGATDRYFDRIKQHETYICFLRKAETPEIPYYTVEVEPGGTIRQHRGYLDEEPDIEEIKPFLREWQQVIRKRMKERDHELEAASRVKREANIEELRAKNNTRVLEGLLEDFMEAI